QIDAEGLLGACGELSKDAGLTIRTVLEPLGGPGVPVKPAVYAGGRYQLDRRWDHRCEPPEPVDVVVVDNVPSQANRLEAALERLRPHIGLPEMVLDLSSVGVLPPHLPERLSSFRFPHRQADAYLRDAVLDGTPFPKTEIGRSLLAATADEPESLFEWFPQALVFGFWQSHLGKKGSQAKLARSWVSEVVGYRPASVETRAHGLKGDPLNLSVDEPVEFDPDDPTDWALLEGGKKAGTGKAKERLSELGHGQVPVPESREPLAGVSFARIEQRSTVSFAALRRIWAGSEEVSAPARALLVAIGIAAHVTAFGRSFSLRSGCELRPCIATWSWLGENGDEEVEAPTIDEAIELVRECASRSESAGLPVGSRWPSEALRLEPAGNLAKAIRSTWAIEA
ncbi:MAG: type I-U CRISPR-associated RAMP protein Csb1/Cas7u, partial [Acidimicrobiia bacterium]|nr:type I-U CRISPR-associated RAMP protein Csb1/Cas7u [Acidimicrobiia bacterium]